MTSSPARILEDEIVRRLETPRRPRLDRVLPIGLGLIAALVVVQAWTRPDDPVEVLTRHFSPLRRIERVPAPELGTGIERWRMICAGGDTTLALWRAAASGSRDPWTVVMLGGLGTGDRAALILPPDHAVNVLAVDWPWAGDRKPPWWKILVRLGPIRAALMKSPAALAHGVEAAARQPEVNRARVALVGASLGVPPALAALRLTGQAAAVALVEGSAQLGGMLHRVLRREGWPEPLAWLLAAAAYRLVRPLEPLAHVEAAADVPVLILNTREDELLPVAGIERLHRSLPGAEVRWRAGPHLHPSRPESIASVVREVERWLEALDGAKGRLGRR